MSHDVETVAFNDATCVSPAPVPVSEVLRRTEATEHTLELAREELRLALDVGNRLEGLLAEARELRVELEEAGDRWQRSAIAVMFTCAGVIVGVAFGLIFAR